MLFNSFAFAVFLPLVFSLYWASARHTLRFQNSLLLVSSYVFYGWWDVRFLVLIFLSSLVDYLVGRSLGRVQDPRQRKLLLWCSVLVNLGCLGTFKYFNFFAGSFHDLMQSLGVTVDRVTLDVVLPVGISFYTFQTLSYTIDIYRREFHPTRDPVAFFAFVSFFPQLVAGPIERARNLLPQFEQPREFRASQAHEGLRLILWGLFKKVVVADNCASAVDTIFRDYAALSGIELALGTFYFAIQIYCDFSGYSEMARGTAGLFGFRLQRNFAYPYFSTNLAEFWRRWHITLSTWFRDYVYIPLGGSRAGRTRQIRNLLATFLISGLWHGANWTFLLWGFLHGVCYLPVALTGANRPREGASRANLVPSVRETAGMIGTFLVTLVTWVFFRADSLSHALSFLSEMVTSPWMVVPNHLAPLAFVGVVLVVEWCQRAKEHALALDGWSPAVRWLVYYGVATAIFLFGNTGHVPFIYFQF